MRILFVRIHFRFLVNSNSVNLIVQQDDKALNSIPLEVRNLEQKKLTAVTGRNRFGSRFCLVVDDSYTLTSLCRQPCRQFSLPHIFRIFILLFFFILISRRTSRIGETVCKINQIQLNSWRIVVQWWSIIRFFIHRYRLVIENEPNSASQSIFLLNPKLIC